MNTQKNCTKKIFTHHDGVITDLEPDILECEVKLALESITMNKASGGDGIPVERFQILKEENSLDQSLEVKECHLQQNFSHGKSH